MDYVILELNMIMNNILILYVNYNYINNIFTINSICNS